MVVSFNFSGDILITKELDFEEQTQFVFNLTASDEFYVRTTLLIDFRFVLSILHELFSTFFS